MAVQEADGADPAVATAAAEALNPPWALPWYLSYASYEPSSSSVTQDVVLQVEYHGPTSSVAHNVGTGKMVYQRIVNTVDGDGQEATQVAGNLVCLKPGLTMPAGSICASFENCQATDQPLPAAKYTFTLSPRSGVLDNDHFYVLVHDIDGVSAHPRGGLRNG